jgi:nucleolar pre-ribosomal-associated protein 1
MHLETLPYSPFVTLLKLLATSSEGDMYAGIKILLISIVRDHEMLQMKTSPDALDALIASLGGSCGSSALVLEFLEDCCARFIKGPVKYFDDLDVLCAKSSRTHSEVDFFSPLLMTLVEQWPFRGEKFEKGNPAEPLAQWLSKLLYLLKLIGEDEPLLELVRDALVASADTAYQEVLKDSFLWKMGKEKAKEALKLATGADFSGSERSTASPVPPEEPDESAKALIKVDLELAPQEDEKHIGLNRWRKKDLEESIEDGDIGELLICLCSKHTEIRLQAVTNIHQLMSRLDVSYCNVVALHLLTSL